jgi:SAM-dependent methyltransferase
MKAGRGAMNTLSRKEYWNSVRKAQAADYKQLPATTAQARAPLSSRVKRLLKKLLGKPVIERMKSYSDFLFWGVLKNHVPRRDGAKLIEIGSSPGHTLLKLKDQFGVIPYGVDYSEPGVELNRKLFRDHNLDAENIFLADFFSDEFHKKLRGSFDRVYSGGFIEHFSNVKDVVDRHISLLKKDGVLIVVIPNVRGFNHLLTRFFDRDLLKIHNLEIMEKETFSRLFDKSRLAPLFCDYVGTFAFDLFATKSNSWKRLALSLCNWIQLPINFFLRLLFRDRGFETKWFSPYLLYIGVKK